MVQEESSVTLGGKLPDIALPTLPGAYFKLIKIIDSGTTDREQISKILVRDPVLCAQVLKLANSAYFSAGRSVQSVDDAIKILGTDVLVTLALTVYVIDAFNDMDSSLMNMKKFNRLQVFLISLTHYNFSIFY